MVCEALSCYHGTVGIMEDLCHHHERIPFCEEMMTDGDVTSASGSRFSADQNRPPLMAETNPTPLSPLFQTLRGDLHPGFLQMMFAIITATICFVAVFRRTVLKKSTKSPLWHDLVAFLLIGEYGLIVFHRFSFIGWPAFYEGLWVCSLVSFSTK